MKTRNLLLILLTLVFACGNSKNSQSEIKEGTAIGGEFSNGQHDLIIEYDGSGFEEVIEFGVHFKTESSSGSMWESATIVDRTNKEEKYIYKGNELSTLKRDIEFVYNYKSDTWSINDLWKSEEVRIENIGTDVSGAYERLE